MSHNSRKRQLDDEEKIEHFTIKPEKRHKEEKPYLFLLKLYLQLKDSERSSHFGNEILSTLFKTLQEYECTFDRDDTQLILTKSSIHDQIRLLL